MALPGENALRAERAAFVETIGSLSDDEFDNGPTLCEGWAPRDVLAHVIGIDSRPDAYLKARGNPTKAHAMIVAEARHAPRARIMNRAEHWAAKPAPLARLFAFGLLTDIAVHHQDVLRGLGRTREIPEASVAAIYRGGLLSGAGRLASQRMEPTDGGRAIGHGSPVAGTREALGLWLGGRKGIEGELYFGGATEPGGEIAVDPTLSQSVLS